MCVFTYFFHVSVSDIPAISQKRDRVPRSAEFKFSRNGRTTANEKEAYKLRDYIVLFWTGVFRLGFTRIPRGIL